MDTFAIPLRMSTKVNSTLIKRKPILKSRSKQNLSVGFCIRTSLCFVIVHSSTTQSAEFCVIKSAYSAQQTCKIKSLHVDHRLMHKVVVSGGHVYISIKCPLVLYAICINSRLGVMVSGPNYGTKG